MATATTSEWTEEKCLQLIREYRARPVLWDQKDHYFFKKSLKSVGWQEISDAIGVSPDKCKHKMVILMSSFRREKAKIVHSMRATKDESKYYTSTWFAFKEMSFLMDKGTERRQLKLPPHIGEWNSKTILKHYIDPSDPPSVKRVKKNPPVPKDFGFLATETIQEEVQAEVMPSCAPRRQTSEDINEEISSFTSFIMNKMKKYSETTKNAVQHAICDIIFKADQNYFEASNCYETFNIIDEAPDPLDKELYAVHNCTIKEQSYSDNSD